MTYQDQCAREFWKGPWPELDAKKHEEQDDGSKSCRQVPTVTETAISPSVAPDGRHGDCQ